MGYFVGYGIRGAIFFTAFVRNKFSDLQWRSAFYKRKASVMLSCVKQNGNASTCFRNTEHTLLWRTCVIIEVLHANRQTGRRNLLLAFLQLFFDHFRKLNSQKFQLVFLAELGTIWSGTTVVCLYCRWRCKSSLYVCSAGGAERHYDMSVLQVAL
jgi:hypothetical protein